MQLYITVYNLNLEFKCMQSCRSRHGIIYLTYKVQLVFIPHILQLRLSRFSSIHFSAYVTIWMAMI